MAEPPKLIRCGDHKLAPWSVVCVHLATGQSGAWVRLPAEAGSQDDWLCPACAEAGLENVDTRDLKAVCVHCTRPMRAACGYED